MPTIDINCDLGEGCANDAELMSYISSANIACGAHAGDAATMLRTAELALKHSVAIGAHPGYRDQENFGRTNLSLTLDEVQALVTEQIEAMAEICERLGARMHHVKPHGALYNQAAKDTKLAAAIAEAVKAFDPELVLYGLSGSVSITEAENIGLRTASEVFADRTYQNDGSLTPRSQPNALITSVEASAEQVLNMAKYSRVRTVDAIMFHIKADTVCIHGDGDHALEFAEAIHSALTDNGFQIQA